MLYVRLLGGTTGFGFDGSNQGAIKAADELAEHLEYNAEGDRWKGGDGWRSRVRSRRRDTGCRDEGTPVRLRHTARIQAHPVLGPGVRKDVGIRVSPLAQRL